MIVFGKARTMVVPYFVIHARTGIFGVYGSSVLVGEGILPSLRPDQRTR